MKEIEVRIVQLENRGYSKSLDIHGEYLKGSDLYYKRITDGAYIVFNHYNKDKKEYLQGFDCWMSYFDSKPEIGKSKAISSDVIKLSFDFKEDWFLLSSKTEEVLSSVV